MVTQKSEIADFEGLFDPERLGYMHQMARKLKLNGLANLLAEPD